MATYKIKKKTAENGTTEEILLPISSIDGLQSELNSTVTQVKVGSTAYNPTSGVVSLPSYPTILPANGGTAENVSGVVAVANGGTGATTAANARTNLGLGSAAVKAVVTSVDTSANLPTSNAVKSFVEGKGYTTNVGDITGVTAGTGLSGGGTSGSVTLNHSNSVTAQTTQALYPIKIDAQGHISSYGAAQTIPTVDSSISASSTNPVQNKVVKSYVDTAISNLVNSAPEALNTLGELATAIEEHEDAYDALLETVGGKYIKPSGGIPKTDLASAVQTSLGKADTALQSYTETDPTVPSWAKASSKPTYTASEVGAVPTTRKVNSKALSSDISLTASDVGALSSSGGNVNGHIYLTGAKESSSTGNTSQIVFGTSSNNHVAVSSNTNALVINPTTTTTTNQIVLYLDKASVFPNGITGNASSATTAANATKLNGKEASYYATKDVATTSASGLMSAADKEIVNRFEYDSSGPQLFIDGGASSIDMNDDAVYITANGGLYHDGNEVAVKSDIPTKTSQLRNDSGFSTWNLSDRITVGGGTKALSIGANNTASGSYSLAAGYSNTVSAMYSNALGYGNKATANFSFATCSGNTAAGNYSFAAGITNTANLCQAVFGKYATNTAGPKGLSDTTGDIFKIGKGTSTSARSNAMRVTTAGKVYGTSSFGSSGADYAEMWEWADGNPGNEDRRGRFVTVDENNKIAIATADDDYILGIISATPVIVGDIQSEVWHEMYLKDVFGENLVETVEVEETKDENTGKVIPAHTEKRWILNPEYDPTKPYVSRDERKEWAAVGLMGKLIVIDDGTCVAGRYCKLTGNGTATSSTDKNDWRVLKRMDSTHVQILYR